LTVRNCDIQGGQGGVYREPGRTLNWEGVSIDTDPNFVLPSYYLSQMPPMGDQSVKSPCVDTGWGTAEENGLGNYTTSSKGANDVGDVDMGIHYPRANGQVKQFKLTLNVIGREHGDVTTPDGQTMFNKYTVVVLTATVDPGYRLRWIGTDDDTSPDTVNMVMMHSDRVVTAIIEQPTMLYVPSEEYPRIQVAVDAAQDGDTIVINEGVYRGEHLIIAGKAITLTGTNPNDPCTVAATVLDGTDYWGRGLTISGGCGPDTVISGLTIANYTRGLPNRLTPTGAGSDGYFGYDIWGGGVYIASGASPTMVNCRIVGCSVSAGNASNGITGGPPEYADDPDDPNSSPLTAAGDGGRGGDGGSAYGGGIYCAPYSSPTLAGCTVLGCLAEGANGDNGGTGGSADGETAVAGHGGNGGHAGGAYGGGIYIGYSSMPTITDCNIIGCSAIGGNAGNAGGGGTASGENSIGGDGGLGGSSGQSYGGGIYFDSGSFAVVSGTSVTGCSIVGGAAGNGGNYGPASGRGSQDGYAEMGGGYLGDYWRDGAVGGGVYCGTESRIMFEKCTFNENEMTGAVSGIGGDPLRGQRPEPVYSYLIPTFGAGVFCDSGSITAFFGCDVHDNNSVDSGDPGDPNTDPNSGVTGYRLSPYVSYGGGICSVSAETVTVSDSNFSGNFATIGGGLWR